MDKFSLIEWSDRAQMALFRLFAAWGPPLAGAAPSYWTYRNLTAYMDVGVFWAVLMGGVVEMVGIAVLRTALKLYVWNKMYVWNKKRPRPELVAPLNIAMLLVGCYLISSIFLTVFLEAAHTWSLDWLLRPAVPALFLILAIVGYVSMALDSDQHQRESDLADEKAERKEKKDVVSGPTVVVEYPANSLPAWLPVRPGSVKEFKLLVSEGVISLPSDLTGAQLGEILGFSEKTGRNWLREVKGMLPALLPVNGQKGQNGHLSGDRQTHPPDED